MISATYQSQHGVLTEPRSASEAALSYRHGTGYSSPGGPGPARDTPVTRAAG